MQKRHQTQDIVKLVLKRTANCRFGGLAEKRPMCHFESNPLIYYYDYDYDYPGMTMTDDR